MCGIGGIVGFDQTAIGASVVKQLSHALRHRGPDDCGFLGWSGVSPVRLAQTPEAIHSGWVSLVHRRLSILDLGRTGWQPM